MGKLLKKVKLNKIPTETKFESALLFPWIELNIYNHVLEQEDIRFEVFHIAVKNSYSINNK
jgi:hypothetical protein